MELEPQNPDYRKRVELTFTRAHFLIDMGVELVDVGPGWSVSELAVVQRHLQQNDFVHAGVQATMADHTAGCAAVSLIGAEDYVLTVEFKINLLRPAAGSMLRCRAQVLKPGRTLSVVESEVFATLKGTDILVSKATVTLAVLQGAGW